MSFCFFENIIDLQPQKNPPLLLINRLIAGFTCRYNFYLGSVVGIMPALPGQAQQLIFDQHGFYDIALLAQQVQDAIFATEMAGTYSNKTRLLPDKGFYFRYPADVPVVDQAAGIVVDIFIRINHGV